MIYNNISITQNAEVTLLDALIKYHAKELIIDGLKTYIISPEYYETILNDEELFEKLNIYGAFKEIIPVLIENAEHISSPTVVFALVRHENRKKFIWEATNVCEYNGHYYHVSVGSGWMCRKCGYVHKERMIMSKAELDPCFLEMEYLAAFEIPDIFKRLPCRNCGNILQNHLLIIE
jgi:hypothetical protein